MSFKGWNMVSIAVLMEFSVIGFTFYCYPLMFASLEKELGASQAQLSGALSLFFICSAAASIVLGRLLDKYSVKHIMLIGGLIFSFGLVSIAYVKSIFFLLLIYATLIAVGGPALGNLSVTKLVANWFDAKAGIALGIAAIGISFSGVMLPILVDPLISLIGWRNVYLVFAAIVIFLLLPIIYLFVVNTPEEINQYKDNDANPNIESVVEEPLPMMDFFKHSSFWFISLAFALQFFSMGGVLLHLIPHAENLGFEEIWEAFGFPLKQTVFAYSLAAFGGVVGKVLFGYLIDRMSANRPVMIMMTMQAAGIFGLTIVESFDMFLISCFVFGLGFGGAMVLMSACFLKAFGSHNLGSVRGISALIIVPVQPLGILIVGQAFDAGIYIESFMLMGAASILALLVSSRISIEKKDYPSLQPR